MIRGSNEVCNTSKTTKNLSSMMKINNKPTKVSMYFMDLHTLIVRVRLTKKRILILRDRKAGQLPLMKY